MIDNYIKVSHWAEEPVRDKEEWKRRDPLRYSPRLLAKEKIELFENKIQDEVGEQSSTHVNSWVFTFDSSDRRAVIKAVRDAIEKAKCIQKEAEWSKVNPWKGIHVSVYKKHPLVPFEQVGKDKEEPSVDLSKIIWRKVAAE